MQDWEAILRRGFESKELDYKGACAWNEGDKKSCCEIVKDILAVANTKGGWIVVGVGETPSGFTWDGLSEDQCKSWETSRLNRFLQNYADPPINTHVIKHSSQDKNYVIVEIPQFPDTPHICQKAYPDVLAPGAVYVRTDNNESAPVKNSADMRAVIEQATRNRADHLLASFRAVLTGTKQPASSAEALEQFDAQVQEARRYCNSIIPKDAQSLGFRETIFHPLSFERLRFTMPDLEHMAEAASTAYRGWVYLFYTEKRADLIEHLDNSLQMTLVDSDTFQFWRLHQSGCLYLNEMFAEDERRESRPQRVLGDFPLIYTCVEAVQCLVNLYADRLPDDENVRLRICFQGVKDRKMAMLRGRSTYVDTPFTCQVDKIVYEQQHALAEWRAGVIPHAFELLKHVNQKFNVSSLNYDQIARTMRELLDRQLR